ncbi:hypothetical protein [Thermosyntropha sp.]|uniref:hypothetical protein n=1 Tax=Thermosyntropha sp. TaxID=2740820 RepID=UPI0025EADEEB|nr:hypothetical protein [Thermosyntropha sp.]MBO8159956.1 hypothetical protein [Thermosyntropha sp.]
MIKGISYAVSPVQQATITTQEEWDNDWKYLCTEKWQDFGFSSPEEVKKAYIGEPFPVKTVDINKFDIEKNIIPQTTETLRYVFPIKVENKIITEIHTGLSKGKWETIMIGGNIIKRLYQIADKNNIPPQKINIVFLGTSKHLVFENNGTETAINILYDERNADNHTSSLQQEIKQLKQTLTSKKGNLENYTGISIPEYEQHKQQESIINRLIRFISYKIQKH